MDGAARNPADCAIWVYRLKTARGLRLGASELRRRYDRLAAQDPHHLPGQSQLLQSLCPKWGGEWPAAHAFARDRMLAAPPGSLNAGLVVEAHLEQWLARDGGRAGQRYLADEPVRAQLYEAARRSVWHDDFRAAPGWVAVAHTFAMAFSLLGDQAATASLFVSLGNLASMHPWRYLGDPGREIRARRARALARGVRR
jgi:hypothetical protein